jgi:feruloyl esterase
MRWRCLYLATAAVIILVRPAAAQQVCESLTELRLSNGRIITAVEVPPGGLTPPSGDASAYKRLPRFCRVALTLKPSSRSNIQAEVWMPSEKWNGKLLVLGTGNFGGGINQGGMALRLAEGYTMASTDTGHSGPAANTFVNHDVLVDFAYRAVHETTVAAKKTLDRFYGSPPKLSYFNGCSTGGRQGLVAAHRYPQDFDGIVAGAPPIRTSAQTFSQIWGYQALSSTGGSLSREKLAFLNDAVMAA